MPKPSTIKDIAAHVGVSTTAVSAVLGKNPSQYVRISDATRTRIMDAAQLLHYRPNGVARSLRYQKTNVIGMYTRFEYLDPMVPFTSLIIGGLHQGCYECGKDMLIHSGYRYRSVQEVFDELVDGRVEGLIVYGSNTDPVVERLCHTTLPVVAITDAVPGLPSVIVDDIEGARLLARHLQSKGHRRIAYVDNDTPITSTGRRFQAFANASDGAEIMRCQPSITHEQFADTDLPWLSLPRDQRPTAIACWNDRTAFNLMELLRLRGLSVPEDVAVVGFDGIPSPSPTQWTVTTIRAPWIAVARTGVEMLTRLLDGEEIPNETILPVELILGNTT